MPEKAGTHLTYEERCQIYGHIASGKSMRAIGLLLERDHSTIVREVNRNKRGEAYDFKEANDSAIERRFLASSRGVKMTEANISLIKDFLLDTQLSPEQLSGRLKEKHSIHISHETIYKFIWKDKAQGGDLFKNLRHRAKKYNKRKGKLAGRGLIPNRVDISERPAIVEKKERFGDFELDTIVGANHQGAIVSIVDRATKCVFLRLLPNYTAELVKEALCSTLLPLGKKGLVKTLTSDNGKEFAAHEKVVEAIGGDFYFATPYHSWERGLNEHTNGLVRQYFPKKTDFATITHEQVAEVERRLNNRPRKILNFSTPTEVFLELTGISP